MSPEVKIAVKKVTDTVSSAAKGLTDEEYDEYLECLISEADGWNMELETR